MKLEQDEVGSYFRKAPEKRLEIIYDNYGRFPQLIDSYEKNLKLLIISEKATIRNRMREDLGTRIQGSGNYSPTEANAITSMMIDHAIASGDFSDSMFKDIPIMEEVYDRCTEISIMKAEYEAFDSACNTMTRDEKRILLPYIQGTRTKADLADEMGLTYEAVAQKIKRIKKELKGRVIRSMRVYD